MQLASLSPVTITKRIEAIQRLALFLAPLLLTHATADSLIKWQRQFRTLAPSSIDLYTRHVQAFYRWCVQRRHMDADPSAALVRPRVPKGKPHPISVEQLRVIFACTTGTLRVVFLLAAFAGLRRGEICRLQRDDIDVDIGTAHVIGKGNKERTAHLMPPLLAELVPALPRSGYLVTYQGRPYDLDLLSAHCRRHLDNIGLPGIKLHSGRHTFATETLAATHDIAFVAELLGHASVATTQIYARPDMDNIAARLRPVADLASGILDPRRRSLRAAS